MRTKKPEGGCSGGISRIRKEEGWNCDKRRDSLTKNKNIEDLQRGRMQQVASL